MSFSGEVADDDDLDAARTLVAVSTTRACAWCGSTSTPQWRKGAKGARLCNPCGVRFLRKRGGPPQPNEE